MLLAVETKRGEVWAMRGISQSIAVFVNHRQCANTDDGDDGPRVPLGKCLHQWLYRPPNKSHCTSEHPNQKPVVKLTIEFPIMLNLGGDWNTNLDRGA